MQQGEEGVILNFHNMLLEFAAPYEVLTRLCGETVCRKGGKQGIESWKWLGLNMQDAEGSILQGGDSRKRSTKGDVIHGYHVDGVVDVGDQSELDAPLD